jgi:hypothetical protein
VSQGNYPPGGQNPFSDKPQGPTNPYQPGQFTDVKSGGSTPRGPVKNYLVESILLLVCCGGVFAIPAIVYACQVNSKLSVGDYNGAVQASNNAKTWCLVALCIGLVCNIGSFVFYFFAMSQAGGPL